MVLLRKSIVYFEAYAQTIIVGRSSHLFTFIQIMLCIYTVKHLSCKNKVNLSLNGSSKMKKPFIFASLKLPSRTLSEYEEEIQLLEGHLRWSEFKASMSKLCFIYFSFVFS